MAERLPNYDWKPSSRHNASARSRRYDWEMLFDGRIRRLTQFLDFDGSAMSLERVIRTSANRRGVWVNIRIESEPKDAVEKELTEQYHAGKLTAVKYARLMADLVEQPEVLVLQAHSDDGRGTVRGVTKSPSNQAIKEAQALSNGNGNGAKAPAKPTAKPVKAAAPTNGNKPKRRLVRA